MFSIWISSNSVYLDAQIFYPSWDPSKAKFGYLFALRIPNIGMASDFVQLILYLETLE